MTNYELTEKLKERAMNDLEFRRKLYSKYLLKETEIPVSPSFSPLKELVKSLEELIMRDIRY